MTHLVMEGEEVCMFVSKFNVVLETRGSHTKFIHDFKLLRRTSP